MEVAELLSMKMYLFTATGYVSNNTSQVYGTNHMHVMKV